ncbi:MAG: hypothetical protein ACXAC8_07540 [Candidatus Hodarchaeales archaeon]|jgi:hypothetical protein
MNQKRWIFIIVFIAIIYLSFLSTVGATPAKPANNVINIGVAHGTKYNVTFIQLEPTTTYTIYFWNERAEFHNLVIAKSGRTVTTATASVQSGDILIGPASSSVDSSDKGGPDRDPWIGELTTPSEETNITYFCSFSGHFAAGMTGTFKVGITADSSSQSTSTSDQTSQSTTTSDQSSQSITPGFELIYGLLIVIGFAVFQSRKR